MNIIKENREKRIKGFLACGIAAAISYVAADIIIGQLYTGYSYADQTISELSAIGAPTSWIWSIIMSALFNPLTTVFGVGVWLSSKRRVARITGAILSLWGMLGYVWLFFPMNMRGAIGETTDAGHLILAGITVVLMTAFIGTGSRIGGRGFRIFSLITMAAMLSSGAWVGSQAPRVAAQLPTPWLGAIERISVYTPMLWMLVLAVILLKQREQAPFKNR